MPRVSVIVPVYNGSRYLPDTLRSVLGQTYREWEVVLVDDGSTDGTSEVVRSFSSEFGRRLRYVYQENRGLSAARNTAIRHASGEFIAILDADDVCLEHRLARSVAAMDETPAAGLVHGRVARIDGQGRLIDLPVPNSAKVLRGHIAPDIYAHRAHIQCPTVMFRRSCIESVGLFDENLRATEDRDMWFRIALQYPVVYIDELLAQYRITGFSMSADLPRMLKAQNQFLQKHRNSVGWMTALEARATVHREVGDVLFGRGLLGAAMIYYSKSVALNPFNIGNLYMLVRTMAEPAFAALRSARRLSVRRV